MLEEDYVNVTDGVSTVDGQEMYYEDDLLVENEEVRSVLKLQEFSILRIGKINNFQIYD